MDKEEFEAFFRAMLTECVDAYGVTELRGATMDWSLRGVAGGQARKIFGEYSIRMNPQLLQEHSGATIDDVQNIILHEIAHLICFANPAYGKGHDKGWKQVCRAIGGDGNRTHSFNLKPSRKVFITRHIYNIGGQSFKFTTQQHKKLQSGRCTVRGIRVKPHDYIETIKIEKKH